MAATNEAFAASWKQSKRPDTASTISAMGNGGRKTNRMRTPHAAAASGLIHRTRVAGATNRLKVIAPTVAPKAGAARMSPTATAPPPRAAASGAETPSGML